MMNRTRHTLVALTAALLVLLAVLPAAAAVTLNQVISREDPKFNCASAVLTVGRDGNVYLSSVIHDGGYILRVSRDGTRKLGGDAVEAIANATANAAGVIATANGHFNHSINLYDRSCKPFAACNEFLVNDQAGWDAPARVEAGASGDFYGLDQHRLRILRISPVGRVVQAYAVPKEAKAWDFRVCEAIEALYLRAQDGTLRCIGFNGAVRWTQKVPDIFTVDEAGTVYALSGTTLKRFTPGGAAQGAINLPVTSVTAIGVFGDELIVKRADSTELFQVHDLATGQLKRVVHSDHERVTAEFPGLVWTAGRPVPFKVQCGNAAARWRVWATALGDSDWRELKRTGEQLDVPVDFAGLYQLRIAPTLNPQADSEYTLRAVIEVRAPASQGVVSVWTPHNRIWWGRGETIPVSVAVRSTTAAPAISLSFLSRRPGRSGGAAAETRELFRFAPTDITWSKAVGSVTLSGTFTAQLAPGRYELRADVPGLTCVAQPIRIGAPAAARSPFRVTQHGDYGNLNSTANVWEFADVAAAMLDRSQVLGVNQYVNRTAAGGYPLAFANDADGSELLRDLEKRLAADPAGVATQKADFGFAHEHALGAFGAHGIREWLLLVGMDAALPIGTSTGYAAGLTPQQYAAEITRYTQALKDYPAFAGWDWVANWWVTDANLRFASPDQKTRYEAALKRADDSGAWDPVLDAVGDRTLGWQPDAQQMFKDSLGKTATNLATASAGPYRRPEVYPPLSFANVDDVDLHFQAEQISTPDWTAHATDFYKQPGKPAWIHPELWNDSGTGEQILPASWLALMRGVDGIGVSGRIPNWGALPTDSRSGYPGIPSVFRALNEFARHYGPWLTTLENNDRLAIVVSRRQVKLDAWRGIGGQYFTRLWEAFMSCLYARQPATFVFPEDAPDLSRFKALLVVGQRYEMEPALSALLAQAQKQGLAILADGGCRKSLVRNCEPLGVAFDHVEKLNGFNEDVAFWEFPQALLANAPLVAATLAAYAPPVAVVDQPEVLVSQRRSGDGRFVWVVNNTHSPLDPGLLWRVNNAIATRQPVVADMKLPVKKGEVVYDVFAQKAVPDSGVPGSAGITADLRFGYARLYAVLPRAIGSVELRAARDVNPGQPLTWTATVPGVRARLPLRAELRDGNGALLEERSTATGTEIFTAPVNAVRPVTLTVVELVSGTRASAVVVPAAHGARGKEPRPPSLAATAADHWFGPRLRDLAVSPDGAVALVNAFAWGENLYALDLATGKLRWSGQIGDHFAYAPIATRDGFAAQGYDLHSGEGYHLCLFDGGGREQRRFALPGLPSRLTNWAFAPHLNDRINNFAVAPDGSWVAAAGNLGLAVWSASGKLLWSRDWSATRRETMSLLAVDGGVLVTGQGMKLAAVEAQNGKTRWEVELAPTGTMQGLAASADGRTIAVRATTRSGRVFVVRDGKPLGTLPTAAEAAVLSPDGAQVAVASGCHLKWYAADGRLQWVFRGDDTLRHPAVSPDGKRLAVGSELGTLYVFEIATGRVHRHDLGALAAPACLPDGDLVAATWMGRVSRFGPDGQEKWQARLGAESQAPPAPTGTVVTTRVTFWSNAEATTLPLTPNLIAANSVIVRAMLGNREVEMRNPAAMLFDGQTRAAANPWLAWASVGAIDSGWQGSFSLEIDTFRTQLRVSAITFVEDPAHPESWLRDARLEYWDPAREQWVFSQYLTSDAPIHTHKLVKAVEAAKFRLARPDGAGWPASNLRLAKIVFHGQSLGASHPDAIRNQPVAVLFDERESDLSTVVSSGAGGSFQRGGAFSGGTYIRVEADKFTGPSWQPPFGHAVPNWDFEIVEKPEKPGQYRWLQFAYKALAPQTRGVSLRIGGEWPGGAVVADLGEPFKLNEGVWVRTQLAAKPAANWTVVRLDLWQTLQGGLKDKGWWKGDFHVRCLNLGAVGGPAGFDRILLGRTEAALAAGK